MTPDELSATDWAILKHVSLYHLTFLDAVNKLFFSSEKEAAKALASLTEHGYLKNHEFQEEAEPNPPASTNKATSKKKSKKSDSTASNAPHTLKMGCVPYYLLGGRCNQLAPTGFKFVKERVEPPNSEQSLYKHLGALWYCLFDGARRYRLDMDEIEMLLGRPLPDSPAYCIAPDEDGPAIYRIYPCRKDNVAQAPGAVRHGLNKLIVNYGLNKWIDSGRFGYAIIVSSEARKSTAERALQREKKKDELLAKAKITVHYAPTPTLLGNALKQRAESGQGESGVPNEVNDIIDGIDDSPPDEPLDLSFSIHT